MNIRYDDKELVASGSFLTFGTREPSAIELEHAGDTLRLLVTFGRDEEANGATASFQTASEDTLEVRVLNLESSSILWTPEPIEVGTVADRPAFLVFRISGLSPRGVHEVSYSFYLENEAADD